MFCPRCLGCRQIKKGHTMHFMPKGRLKHILAGLGAVYLVLFAGYLIHAALNRSTVQGPSDLELHPEKAAEIRAKERAEELQTRLKLTDEQTKQAVEIFQKHAPMGGPGGPPPGDPREGFQAMRDELCKILTPEQQALQSQMGPPGGPGGPRGPGGPGGPGRGPGGPPGMNSERMDALKSAMTPEQKERFEKQMERMKNRMPPGPPGGGRGGPGGGPPGGPGGFGGPPPPGM